MGKKYLDIKKDSLEESILDIWQTAAEEAGTKMDGRTRGYKSHRSKLESRKTKREEKKELGEELSEGRMKDLYMLIKQKKSAEEIAKIMKVDVKTIKSFMADFS